MLYKLLYIALLTPLSALKLFISKFNKHDIYLLIILTYLFQILMT